MVDNLSLVADQHALMQKASTGIKTEKVVREISGLETEVSKAV